MKKLLLFAMALLVGMYPVIAADINVGVNVEKYISVTFSYTNVNFGTVSAGSTNVAAPNQGNGVYNVSIETNYDYVVKARGTDFTYNSRSFGINNLKFYAASSTGGLNVNNAVALSTTDQTINTFSPTVTTNYHGYWLSIPVGQYAGNYYATVTITYANA